MAQRGGGGPSLAYDDAADVTHSTAFAVLNALVDEGQLSEERAEYLKQKFTELHSRVLAIYKRDNTLLKRARQLRSRLEAERQHVYSCGDAAKRDDETIQTLKRNLMEQERDLTAALERESVLQVEVLEYDRRKQHLILEREDAVAAEEARLRPKMEALQANITEMGNHIKELAAEQERYESEQARLKEEEEQHKSDIANFAATLAQARQQLQNVHNEPERAQKQLEMVLNSLIGAQRELANTEDKIASHAERITALEIQRDNRASDLAMVRRRVHGIRTEIETKRKTLATMNTSLEVELETRQATQERVAELDQLLLTAKIALQQENDAVTRMERDKEKCLRLYAGVEQAKEVARHEHESLQEQMRLVLKEVEQVIRGTAGVRREIENYRKDAEARTKRLLAEQAKSEDFIVQADQALLEIREVEDTIATKARQDEVKRKELKAVLAKRQELSRASAREASRVTLAQQELQMQQVYVREAQRRNEEQEKRLSKLVDLFQKVKQQRAQKASQIQSITQAMTQVAEKTRLLERELAVLTRESALQDQEVTKAKYQAHELTQICANLRLEKNRLRRALEKAADHEREVKAQVRRLNGDIASAEDTMVDLRRAYAAAVEGRNQVGIQLIDRNDETALLVARVKAQEAAIADGTKMTNANAADIRLLKTKLSSLLHDLEMCQQSIPKVTQMELELTKVRDEIEAEQWRTQVLGDDLTDPKNPHRWSRIPLTLGRGLAAVPADEAAATTAFSAANTAAAAAAAEGGAATRSNTAAASSALVGGPSEEYVQLQARCQDLEARVQAINARLKEKNLILEEVTELAERVGAQADSSKDVTLALAKQVNTYHNHIRNKSRQMMATISELSLFQASSIQLQQEVQRLEAVVEEAEQRLQVGAAPFVEAEVQYERKKQSDERYAAARQRQKQAAAAQENDGGGGSAPMIVTAAEPRANAYIPEDDMLGLARPFGTFAPFKPTAARVMLTPARTEAATAKRRQPGLSHSPPPPATKGASAFPLLLGQASSKARGVSSTATQVPLSAAANLVASIASPVDSAPETVASFTNFSSAISANQQQQATTASGGEIVSPAAVVGNGAGSGRSVSAFAAATSASSSRPSVVAASHDQVRVSHRHRSGDTNADSSRVSVRESLAATH